MIEGDKAGWIRQKESVYRKLYSALLRKHQGALQASIQEHTPSGQNNDNSYLIMTVNSHDFHHEDEIMNTILRTEVQNLLIGVGATALGFATLRFGSRYAFSLGLFGTTKAKAMQEAEQQAKRRGTDTFQKSFGTTNQITLSNYIIIRIGDIILVGDFSQYRRQSQQQVSHTKLLPLWCGSHITSHFGK